MSNAGKSTVLKQLHAMQGTVPTHIELEETRHIILTGLVDTFLRGLQQTIGSRMIGDVRGVLHVLSHVSIVS